MKICHLLEHIQYKFPQTSKLSCKLSSIHPGGQASYGSLLSCMNNVVSTTCRKGKPTWEFWLPTSRQLNFGDQNGAWQTSIAQHSGKHRSSLVRSIFGQGQSVCASPVREDLWRYQRCSWCNRKWQIQLPVSKMLKKLSKNEKWWKVYKLRTSCSRTGSPRSDMELLNASG